MKRYMFALVLFIGSVTSRGAFADNWTPGTPKPCTVPETWLSDLTGFFGDMWSYLMY